MEPLEQQTRRIIPIDGLIVIAVMVVLASSLTSARLQPVASCSLRLHAS
jgi:hypothetical protein